MDDELPSHPGQVPSEVFVQEVFDKEGVLSDNGSDGWAESLVIQPTDEIFASYSFLVELDVVLSVGY